MIFRKEKRKEGRGRAELDDPFSVYFSVIFVL